MLIIGLTGGIASGKSTIASYMMRHHVPVFDSDKAVHKLLGPKGAAIPQIVARFGDVGDDISGIDRAKLGRKVFADTKELGALEAILHPMVQDSRAKMVKLARMRRCKAVVCDIPLLFETKADKECDVTVMAWAPDFLIRQRALRRPHMTQEKLAQIMARQMSYHERAKLADERIATGLGRGAMSANLHKLFKKWHLR